MADFGLCHQLLFCHAVRKRERLGMAALRLSFPAGVPPQEVVPLPSCWSVAHDGYPHHPSLQTHRDLIVTEQQKSPAH